jgi:hypothetical protein
MTFIDNLTKDLKNNKLTDSSIKIYLTKLKLLNNNQYPTNLKFLNNIDDIKTKINNLKTENTKRSYYISIVSILNTVKDNNKNYKKLYDKYHEMMININNELKKIDTTELTDKEKKKWIDYEDLLKIYDELKDKIMNLIGKDNLNDDEYDLMIQFITLSLYIKQDPRRNDYKDVNIIKEYDENDYTDDKNYYSVKDGKFIFNKYKTVKNFKKQIIDVDKDLRKYLNIYFSYHPLFLKSKDYNIPLLVDKDGKPYDKINSINRILGKIKKGLSSSLIRHSFLSWKFGDKTKEQKQISENMAHSMKTNQEYVKVV